MRDIEATIRMVQERHEFWYWHLLDYVGRIGVPGNRLPSMPKYDFAWTAPDKAGQWHPRNGGVCTYYMPYVVSVGVEKYDETIAHELCHHFQQRIFPRDSKMPKLMRRTRAHGEMFYLLFHIGCGMTHRDHCHEYSKKEAQKLVALLSTYGRMRELKNGGGNRKKVAG